MSGILSTMLVIALGTVIVGGAFAGLHLAFGRKKKAEDKAIGVLEEQAIFNAGTNKHQGTFLPKI